jgi:hypothetical protein
MVERYKIVPGKSHFGVGLWYQTSWGLDTSEVLNYFNLLAGPLGFDILLILSGYLSRFEGIQSGKYHPDGVYC